MKTTSSALQKNEMVYAMCYGTGSIIEHTGGGWYLILFDDGKVRRRPRGELMEIYEKSVLKLKVMNKNSEWVTIGLCTNLTLVKKVKELEEEGFDTEIRCMGEPVYKRMWRREKQARDFIFKYPRSFCEQYRREEREARLTGKRRKVPTDEELLVMPCLKSHK